MDTVCCPSGGLPAISIACSIVATSWEDMELKESSEELKRALKGLENVKACVIGDLVLDRYIWGRVERISPEAPVPVVHIQKTEDRLGCAGNAAVNLRRLGVDVTLCSIIGEDEEGRALERILGTEGVSSDNIFIDQYFPSIVKTRVLAQSQQIVRIDREVIPEPSPERIKTFLEFTERCLGDPDVIIISDYGKGTIFPQFFEFLSSKRAKGELKCPVIVDPHPNNFNAYKDISLAKPNRAEAERATGIDIVDKPSALSAARKLREQWLAEMMMVTLGEDGLVLVSDEYPDGLFLETMAKSVFDVSGAGDTVTAVFSAALGAGTPVAIAGQLANIAAGIVVSEVGTVPISKEKLTEFLDNIHA